MRVIAGEWRGRPLAAPEGGATRPTSDRAREGLFSMLASRIGSFDGLKVADLYAGSGALGIEALSRGAASCLFLDHDRAAILAIQRNLDRLGATGRGELRSQKVEHAAAPRAPCDLIFMDPPYGEGVPPELLERLSAPAWLAPGGIISAETQRTELDLPSRLEPLAVRRFGKAVIHLLRRGAE